MRLDPPRLVFKIRGLDCAEEVAVLKRALLPLLEQREERLRFDVVQGKLSVLGEASADEIKQAVARTGMEAIVWQDRGHPEQSFWQKQEQAILCAVSALLLGLGVLVLTLYSGGWLAALRAGGGAASPLPARLLLIASAVAGAWHVLPRAWLALRALRPDMNLLMSIAVLGALLIGEWVEAASVAFLFSLALLLERWSVGRARRAIEKLMQLAPETARYLCPHDGDVMEAGVAEIPVGATVLVRPGERIPLDGVISKGRSSVDQSPITGESIPIQKEVGEEVFAGTINGPGAIELITTRPAAETTLARIIHLVEEAQSHRAASERWVDRFARYYTPLMLLAAALVATLAPLLIGGGLSHWLYQALVILVIACPCALVISTPVSIVAGLATAARRGVLIKGGVFLEMPARLQALALDKTGTLTEGRPRVERVVDLQGLGEQALLLHAAALETHSTHPLARAILEEAAARGLQPPSAEGFQHLPGRGAEAQIDGRAWALGNLRLAEERGAGSRELLETARGLEDAGHTVVVVLEQDPAGAGPRLRASGLIGVADGLRPQAARAIRELRQLGLEHLVLLTGDNRRSAEAVAAAAGIDECHAELLPEEKVELVRELGRRHGLTGMVGDGVNDAPALGTASLGIAMGATGSDAAIETADVALMSDDLLRLPWLRRHSLRTLSVIKQNIVFALGLKALFLGLALLGQATLWMAIAADMGASLLVIANGLRLLRSPPEPSPGPGA